MKTFARRYGYFVLAMRAVDTALFLSRPRWREMTRARRMVLTAYAAGEGDTAVKMLENAHKVAILRSLREPS